MKYQYETCLPGGSIVKKPPAVWESWAQSLGLEDSLEESMATHSSIFAWRILMDRGAWQAKELDTTEQLSTLSEQHKMLKQ